MSERWAGRLEELAVRLELNGEAELAAELRSLHSLSHALRQAVARFIAHGTPESFTAVIDAFNAFHKEETR